MGLSSLVAMGCAGVTLLRNAVRTRLYTTAGNGEVIWGYLRGSWRGSLPKPLITRRSQSTQLTSRHTARPPAWGKKRGAWTSDWPHQRRYEHETARSDRHDWAANPVFMTAGQVSDYTGARALVSNLPAAEWLLGDRGYDADWFREALVNMAIKPCIPGRKSRSNAIKYDKRRYKKRNRIEIMFGRLKDWRRVATRYNRCPKVSMSAIALAATVLFLL